MIKPPCIAYCAENTRKQSGGTPILIREVMHWLSRIPNSAVWTTLQKVNHILYSKSHYRAGAFVPTDIGLSTYCMTSRQF